MNSQTTHSTLLIWNKGCKTVHTGQEIKSWTTGMSVNHMSA